MKPLIGKLFKYLPPDLEKPRAGDWVFVLFACVVFFLVHIRAESEVAIALILTVTLLSFLLAFARVYFIPSLAITVLLIVRYLMTLLPGFSRNLGYWPFDMFFIFIFLWALRFLINRFLQKSPPPESRKISWRWRLSKFDLISTAIVIVPTVACLSIYYFTHPEVSAQFPLPNLSGWQLPLFVIIAAIVNGLREEILYRWGLQDFIGERWNQVAALLISSFAFGALHFAHGFPQGYLGVFLTTLFGLVVGLQLLITRNFVAVWLTHTLADAIMFSLIIMTR